MLDALTVILYGTIHYVACLIFNRAYCQQVESDAQINYIAEDAHEIFYLVCIVTPLKIAQEETENAHLFSTLTSNTLGHGLFIHQVIKM